MPISPGSPAMSAAELCDALKAAGFVLVAESTSSLRALGPRAQMTEEIAYAITYHKLALIRTLAGMEPQTPFACRFCAMEFVSMDAQDCVTCADLRGKPFRFKPGSVEESAFLVALSHRMQRGGVTVPTVPSRELTPSGTHGTAYLTFGKVAHVRAYGESYRKRVPSVPSVPAFGGDLFGQGSHTPDPETS